jgi:hypothetical protein
MKTIILLLSIILILPAYTNAQHCKFDGQNVMVIKIENTNGKPKSLAGFGAKLKNVNDSATVLCESYSTKWFDTCKNILLNTEDKIWNSYAQKYSSLKLFKIKECYAIILSDAELACLLGANNAFQIAFKHRFRERSIIFTATKKDVYPLCSSYGEWADIKPFVIKLPDIKKFDGH